MDYIAVATLVWTALFLLLGFVRGFWKGLSACVSIVLAYWGSANYAGSFAEWLNSNIDAVQLSSTVAWGVSAFALFVLISILVRTLFYLIEKSVPISNTLANRGLGALLSGVHGAAIGVFILWGFSVLVDSWEKQSGRKTDIADSPLVDYSRELVASLSAWNMRKSGASDTVVGLTAAITENPTEVLDDVKGTFKSTEFQNMLNNEEIKSFIASKDLDSLKQSPEFQAFMNNASLKKLQQKMADNGVDWNQDEIASFTSDIWTNIDDIKNNPEYQQLINDPEVRDFLNGKGELNPGLLNKAQDLLSLVAGADENKKSE